MTTRIFGMEWEEIQARQQRTYRPQRVTGPYVRPIATYEDIALLAQHGADGLHAMGYAGVLDRLRASGMLP